MPISFIISIIPTILDDKAKGWTISCIRWKSSQSKSQVSAEPPTFHGQPLKSTIFQWLNHVKSQLLRLKPWFFRYFPWWNQGFHLIFHGFPWLNPAFSLVEWGTHSFPMVKPTIFPMVDPSIFRKVDPPDRAEIGRAAWRYLHAMAAQFPETPRRNEAKEAQAPVGKCGKCGGFFPWFFYRFFPWKIEVDQHEEAMKTRILRMKNGV